LENGNKIAVKYCKHGLLEIYRDPYLTIKIVVKLKNPLKINGINYSKKLIFENFSKSEKSVRIALVRNSDRFTIVNKFLGKFARSESTVISTVRKINAASREAKCCTEIRVEF